MNTETGKQVSTLYQFMLQLKAGDDIDISTVATDVGIYLRITKWDTFVGSLWLDAAYIPPFITVIGSNSQYEDMVAELCTYLRGSINKIFAEVL